MRDKKNVKIKEEWESLLLHTLLQQRCSQDRKSILEKHEVVATISGPRLGIIFRKNIEGIIQRLGELTLQKDEDLEIDTVSWAHIAAQRSNTLEGEIESLTANFDSQSRAIQKLNQQLDDLIDAKREHEHALLQKFVELLNAKKLKIRDQQRLLAAAKVDSEIAAKVQAARSTTKARTPGDSREAKRKAATSESEDEKDGFAPKHGTKREEDELSETINTPEPSDGDVTEDEINVGDGGEQATSEKNLPERGKAKDGMQLDTPPPSRELPFGNADQDRPTASGRISADTPQASRLNDEAGNEVNDTTDDDDEL